MKIKIESMQYQIRKTSELPQEIELNKEVSWMIGLWTGDNWSSREGTVIRNEQKSSGRFGINNNDEEVIQRFLEGLKTQFRVTKIKIDVQVPRNQELNKEKTKRETSKKFDVDTENINVYKGSPWRKNLGYAIYTNNTALLRIVNYEIYKKLPEFIQTNDIDVNTFLQGIADSEGDVDKANKIVKITNKDQYVISLIELALRKLNIQFKRIVDKENRTRIKIKDLVEFDKKIGFWIKRKKLALEEMIGGNFVREKDKWYLKKFEDELKKGTKIKEISERFGISHPTAKMVLRNLASNKLIERKNSGHAYIYYLP